MRTCKAFFAGVKMSAQPVRPPMVFLHGDVRAQAISGFPESSPSVWVRCQPAPVSFTRSACFQTCESPARIREKICKHDGHRAARITVRR
jgi:hypothetical protein